MGFGINSVITCKLQGYELKTTMNFSYQPEGICTWTTLSMGIMELVDTCEVRFPYSSVSSDGHRSMEK